jgi:hypothetical protein
MSAIILHRTDPATNMRRFYRLDVQPDLFGQWCFIRPRHRYRPPARGAYRGSPENVSVAAVAVTVR